MFLFRMNGKYVKSQNILFLLNEIVDLKYYDILFVRVFFFCFEMIIN